MTAYLEDRTRFINRVDAGLRLAERIRTLHGDLVIAGLPRGGVVVAAEVARVLRVPLTAIVVRKLGLPGHPELAMGAVGEGGVLVLDQELISRRRISRAELEEIQTVEYRRLERRVAELRAVRTGPALAGHHVVVVDDGIATGATARAAIAVARAQGASRVSVGVPVAAWDAVQSLSEVADEVVCVTIPATLEAVGQHYLDFRPVSDDEVLGLLEHARQGAPIA